MRSERFGEEFEPGIREDSSQSSELTERRNGGEKNDNPTPCHPENSAAI